MTSCLYIKIDPLFLSQENWLTHPHPAFAPRSLETRKLSLKLKQLSPSHEKNELIFNESCSLFATRLNDTQVKLFASPVTVVRNEKYLLQLQAKENKTNWIQSKVLGHCLKSLLQANGGETWRVSWVEEETSMNHKWNNRRILNKLNLWHWVDSRKAVASEKAFSRIILFTLKYSGLSKIVDAKWAENVSQLITGRVLWNEKSLPSTLAVRSECRPLQQVLSAVDYFWEGFSLTYWDVHETQSHWTARSVNIVWDECLPGVHYMTQRSHRWVYPTLLVYKTRHLIDDAKVKSIFLILSFKSSVLNSEMLQTSQHKSLLPLW